MLHYQGDSGRRNGLNKVALNIHENQMLGNSVSLQTAADFHFPPPGEGRVSREGWQRVIWAHCVCRHPAPCPVGLAGCLAVLRAIPSLHVACCNDWGLEVGGGGPKQTPPRV